MKNLSRIIIYSCILSLLFFVGSIKFAHAEACNLTGNGSWSANSANLGESVIAKFPEQNCNGTQVTLQFFGKSGGTTFHIKDINYSGQIPAIGQGYVDFSASDFQGKSGDIQVYFIPKSSSVGAINGTASELLIVSLTNNGSTATGVLDLHFDVMPGVSPKVVADGQKVLTVATFTIGIAEFGNYCNDINITSFKFRVLDNAAYTMGSITEKFDRTKNQFSMTESAMLAVLGSDAVPDSSGNGKHINVYAAIQCGSGNGKQAAISAPVTLVFGTGQLEYSCVAPDGKGGYVYACSKGNIQGCTDIVDSTTKKGLCSPNSCTQIPNSLCGSPAPAPGSGGSTCGGVGQPACSSGGGTGGSGGTSPGGAGGGTGTGTTIPAGQSQTYSFNITNPLAAGPNDLFDIINIVTQWIMYIAVPLAVLWIMYAGFLMLTAGPKPENFQKGRDILKYTILGLAIIFIGKGFVSLIISIIELGGSTPQTSTTVTCNNGVCSNGAVGPCLTPADCQSSTSQSGLPGNACQQASNCQASLVCNNGMCAYPKGNGTGDPCRAGADCAQGLACDSTSANSKIIDGRQLGTCFQPLCVNNVCTNGVGPCQRSSDCGQQ